MPSCSRCSRSRLDCLYVASRRGQRRRPPRSNQQIAHSIAGSATAELSPAGPLAIDHWSGNYPFFEPGTDSCASISTNTNLGDVPTSKVSKNDVWDLQLESMSYEPRDISSELMASHYHQELGQLNLPTLDSHPAYVPNEFLIQTFYLNFHPAHPMLPPWNTLQLLEPPDYLLRAMEFTALHYLEGDAATFTGQNMAVMDREICSTILVAERSVELVQTLLLLSIVLHSRNQVTESRAHLTDAIDTALSLGLHRRNYAHEMSFGNAVREESLRRTWWELFVVDALLASLQHQGNLLLDIDKPEVYLPCPEDAYNAELSSLSSVSVQDLEHRSFSEQEPITSPAAHRIEATMLLRATLSCTRDICISPEKSRQVEARISGWFYSMSDSEQRMMRSDNMVDEMLFQAFMLAYCSSIFLHVPQSNLLSSLTFLRELACGIQDSQRLPCPPSKIHTVKALKAAMGMSELSCLPAKASSHTPLFICCLILSSITLLAVYLLDRDTMPDRHLHLLSLNVNVLKSVGGIWAVAFCSMAKIKAAVRDALTHDAQQLEPRAPRLQWLSPPG